METLEWAKENLLFVLVALVLAFGMYSTIGLALDTSVPVVAVTSDSMTPTFERGDMVIVHGKQFSAVEEGDILVFEHACMPVPVIHRVISRTDNTVSTQGDANQDQVAFCAPENGAGRCQPTRTRNCPAGYEFTNIEAGITEDRVLGTAWFIVPEIGHLKLYPTCLYYKAIYASSEDTGLTC